MASGPQWYVGPVQGGTGGAANAAISHEPTTRRRSAVQPVNVIPSPARRSVHRSGRSHPPYVAGWDHRPSRMGSLSRALAMGHDPVMQVIASNATSRSDRLAVARSALSAGLLLLAGVMTGWLCLGTPLLSELQPSGRPSAMQVAAGVFGWAFAIVVPAGFLLFGLARAVATLDAASALRPRAVAPRLAKSLGSDHLAVTDLHIPGGRRIHELILGPFGIVVLGDLPPASVSRHSGDRWEIRDRRGRWIPIEGPLVRASRDAERVRGWLTADDRDFLVRVYAAVVTRDPSVARTPTCAVVAPDALATWLAGLPAQRGLTPSRLGRLGDLIRSFAGGG